MIDRYWSGRRYWNKQIDPMQSSQYPKCTQCPKCRSWYFPDDISKKINKSLQMWRLHLGHCVHLRHCVNFKHYTPFDHCHLFISTNGRAGFLYLNQSEASILKMCDTICYRDCIGALCIWYYSPAHADPFMAFVHNAPNASGIIALLTQQIHLGHCTKCPNTAVRALVWNNGTLLCKIDFNRNLSF